MLETFNPSNWRQLVEQEDLARLQFFDDRGVVFRWLNVLDEVVYSEEFVLDHLWSPVFPAHTFQAELRAGVRIEQEIHPLGIYSTIHMVLDQVADLLTLAGLRVPQLPYD